MTATRFMAHYKRQLSRWKEVRVGSFESFDEKQNKQRN